MTLHSGSREGLLEVARKVRKLSWEHLTARRKKEYFSQLTTWKPPPGQFTKVNVDVAVRENFSVIAAVLRNERGEEIHHAMEKRPTEEATVGEAKAARLGVSEALKKGYKKIILEGDSLQVRNAIKGFPRRMDWNIHNIISDTDGKLQQLDEWKVGHIRSGVNNVVHCPAHWALSEFSSGSNPYCMSIVLSYFGCIKSSTPHDFELFI